MICFGVGSDLSKSTQNIYTSGQLFPRNFVTPERLEAGRAGCNAGAEAPTEALQAFPINANCGFQTTAKQTNPYDY